MIGFLANESPWPARNGGRARMAGLVQELRPGVVLVARRRGAEEVGGRAVGLPVSRRSRPAALLGPGPRLGRGLLDDRSVKALRERCADLSALVVSHSYLAAQLPDLGLPLVVDLPNLEVERQGAAPGAVAALEALKARRWEPAVARRAALAVCVDEQDAAVVRGWGAREVVVVPNVVDVPLSPPSPADGPALLVADWRYGPNAEALRWFLWEVAPRLTCDVVVAGRGSEDVHGGLGFVDDLGPLYDAAAVVVSPVRQGAGTQLKVVEALTRGRLVVTTAYGARSVPAGAEVGAEVTLTAVDLAQAVNRLVNDVAERARREILLRAAGFTRTWGEAARPLLRALAEVARA